MIDQIMQLEDREAIDREVEGFCRFLQCLPDELKKDLVNEHHFAPGIYIREMLIKKGDFVIGKKHKTKHFNIILSGSGKMIYNGELKEVNSGDIFVSEANMRKSLLAYEDVRILNIFPTNETNIEKLEEELSHDEPEPTDEEMKLFNEITNRRSLCQWE